MRGHSLIRCTLQAKVLPLIENSSIYTPAGTKGLQERGEVEEEEKGKGRKGGWRGKTQSSDGTVKKDRREKAFLKPHGRRAKV